MSLNIKNVCYQLLGAALALAASPRQTDAAEKPNIIIIMADDVGYGDVGCYGADPSVLATPNIDRLAAEGRRFTSGYAVNSTCTPTRYAMLTGQYAWRESGTGIGGVNSTLKIDQNRLTIGDVMKSAGYNTAVIGKWHLGLGSGSRPDWNGQLNPGPLELGFDYCFLLPNTNDRVPSVYVENHEVLNLDPADPLRVETYKFSGSNPYSDYPKGDLVYTSTSGHNNTVWNNVGRIGYFSGGTAARWRDQDMADDFIDKATEWIEDNTNKPFFLYFASQDNHVPRLPHERFQGESALGWRGDAIVQLDWSVGELVNTLEDLGIATNTMIVFCSDNGPVLDDGYNDGSRGTASTHHPAGGFRGSNQNDWKYSIYEGGTRTPFITWWPGRIAPGTVSDEIVSSIDLAASFADLTGQPITESGALPDSFNLMDELLGVAGAKGRNHIIQANNNGSTKGYRQNNWKIAKGSELYNLETDPFETTNLSGSQPEKLAEMQAWQNTLVNMESTAGISLIVSAAGYGSVSLDWIDSGTTNVASYSILRGTSMGGPYSTISTGIVDSAYTDYTQTNNVPYYYVVTTLFNDGTSPFDSNEASATPLEFPSNATNLFMEAEDSGSFSGRVVTKGTNWSGSGYVDLDEAGHIDFIFYAPVARKFDLELNTAGDADDMALELSINGNIMNPALAIPNTTSWNAIWALTTETNISLNAGLNTIRFRDNGSNQPQFDRLRLIQLPDAFDVWTNQFGLAGGAMGNADGDDLNNLYEYGLGGNPTNAQDTGHLPQAFQSSDSGSNWLIYVHPRLSDPFSGITYTLELADNLLSNVWNAEGYEIIGIETNGFEPGIDAVTNRIVIDAEDQQFFRLNINRP